MKKISVGFVFLFLTYGSSTALANTAFFVVGEICPVSSFTGGPEPLIYRSALKADSLTLLKKIERQFTAINLKLDSYKKISRDMPGFSAEGGTVTGYYEQSELVKSQTVFYAETGKVETDYYFFDNRLFFQYSKETVYNKPIYIKGCRTKKVQENRLYFDKDRIIRWIDNHTVKPYDNREFIQRFLTVQTAIKEFKKVL